MTIEQTIADEIARIHVEINDASDAYRQRLHDAVRSWANVHRQNQELQALVNRQRAEIERLTGALRTADEQTDDLLQECNDLRAARHNDARLLTDIRGALGAVDDADLVEVARKTVHVIEQTDLFRQRHIAERDRAVGAIRAYKAAVDAQSGVADAKAALFAWLGENDHVAT